MESEFARRRISAIAGHFAGTDDFSASASCLLPLTCSSSLSSAVTRYDNKVFFARQGSSAQSCFMRQASTDLGNPGQPGGVCSTCGNGEMHNALEAPLFSRPAKSVDNFNSFNAVKDVEEDCRLRSAAEPPRYARASSMPNEKKNFGAKEEMHSSKPPNGVQWSPMMNVAEYKCKYVISLGLPGVNVGDIRVEVNAKSLIVTDRRATKWTKVGCCSNNLFTTTYHKRETLQGPFQVIWPLPANVNKDGVSAEFVEGVLRINIPKL